MPAAVLLGGDQPWLRRVLGVSVASQPGGVVNEAVCDNPAKQWNGTAVRRTTQSDANNHRRYLVTRKSLDAARCTGEPLLVIATNRLFLCILHCCMAFGRLFVASLEARVGTYPPQVAGKVQKILYRNRCGVRLGAHNAVDGEEAHNLFRAWEQIAPLLAYVEQDPTWQAVVVLRTLLRTLYSPISPVPRPSCRLVAAAFREHCCGESLSRYLLFLEDARDAMLETADACGVGLAAVLGDVVESVNYILKKGYNGHSARGGGAGKSAVEREAMVVQQVWEWWFLTFDLPLLHYNTPHTALCTAASLVSTTPQAPTTHVPSATQLSYSLPIHRRRRDEEAAGGELEGDIGPGGMLLVVFILRSQFGVHKTETAVINEL